MAGLKVILLLLVSQLATSVRLIKRRGSLNDNINGTVASIDGSGDDERQTAATRGEVDELFTFGGAGPFKDVPSSSCFPGLRVITEYKRGLLNSTVDIVPKVTRFLTHFKMDVERIDINNGQATNFARCSAKDPVKGFPSYNIHPPAQYEKAIPWMFGRAGEMFVLARAAYREDPAVVYARLGNSSYKLVNTAVSQTDWNQITHLFQHPDNLDCVLTFHGTDSKADWAANFKLRWVDFCGLETKVHDGFSQQLRRMIRNPQFQSNIRSKLPFCKKLTVVGHSMGGAVAELLAACLQKAAAVEDYGLVEFAKETPKKLSYIVARACNWQCYLDRYPDLQSALGATNTTEAESHYDEYGRNESRDCTCPQVDA